MRWVGVMNTSDAFCVEVTAFKDIFYTTFLGGDVFVYDPYSMIGTPLMPSPPPTEFSHLVRAGDDDELFLVQQFNPYHVQDFKHLTCRVSILDEYVDKWVVVSDLGDHVFFIGHCGNVSCSAKELPNGCGVSENSIVFTTKFPVTYAYKYGVDRGDGDDNLTLWRFSRENRVNCLMRSPLVSDGEYHVKNLSTSPMLVLWVEL